MYSNGWIKTSKYHTSTTCNKVALRNEIAEVCDGAIKFYANRNSGCYKQVPVPVQNNTLAGVYALDESTIVFLANGTTIFIFDVNKYSILKQFDFKNAKTIFQVSSQYIGVVTYNRVKIISAYDGAVVSESFFPGISLGKKVIMGMTCDTLFIETDAGRATYILRQVGIDIDSVLKNKDFFCDTVFWFHDEEQH
jgi:hypothetical protein